MDDAAGFVGGFREAVPYIYYLRSRVLAVGISSSLLSSETPTDLTADLDLLASLDVRLVVVHGSRTQINVIAQVHGIKPQYHSHHRTTDETVLQYAKQAPDVSHSDIEATLYNSVPQTLQRSSSPTTASGNFLAVKPLGVIDGVDMGYAGIVRKADTEAMRHRLDDGVVILISPLGYSFSGETLNLSMGETAGAVAVVLHAEKLVYTVEQKEILDTKECLIANLSAAEAHQRIGARQICPDQTCLLLSMVKVVEGGVGHTQVLSGRRNGSLICELFTRNDAGTLVVQSSFVSIRKVRGGDIPNITEMIRPLAEQGTLLRRDRECLKNHIGNFSVIEHDCHTYGCVALKTLTDPDYGELACLAASPDAYDDGYGETLPEHLLQKTRARRIRKLFALSTHTGRWFAERGFQAASADGLPEERRCDYMENRRSSRVFVYDLMQSR